MNGIEDFWKGIPCDADVSVSSVMSWLTQAFTIQMQIEGM